MNKLKGAGRAVILVMALVADSGVAVVCAGLLTTVTRPDVPYYPLPAGIGLFGLSVAFVVGLYLFDRIVRQMDGFLG